LARAFCTEELKETDFKGILQVFSGTGCDRNLWHLHLNILLII